MVSFVVKSEADRSAMVMTVKVRPLPFTVEIVKGKRRSVEQNRLQRMWLNEAAEQMEDRTAEEWRAECKLTIGVPMLRAENDLFREKYDRLIRPMPVKAKLEMMAEPLDFPVTRLMSTEQKTRYLDLMARHLTSQGVMLTEPGP